MKEAKFIASNRSKWEKIENISGLEADTLAANFIQLSDDLAYARTFYPDSDTEQYLNQLMALYQSKISRHRRRRKNSILDFWKTDLPLLLYKERKPLLFALAFFLLSCFIGWFSAWGDEGFIRLILGDGYVNMTLKNIEEGKPMGVYSSMDPWAMFFRITFNNIRVSFIAFLFGVFLSVGALVVLFQNGVMLGSFQYFFYAHGLFLHSALSIWAHGTFEITSIVIAGGAGLVVGNSFLFPGTYSRAYSFRKGAMRGIKIVTGLIPFFIIAGGIESFITRYADAYPIIGAFTVLISLAGVVTYFVWYPFFVFRKTSARYEVNGIYSKVYTPKY